MHNWSFHPTRWARKSASFANNSCDRVSYIGDFLPSSPVQRNILDALLQGYEIACRAATKCLEEIAHKFEFSVDDREPLIQTCMTTLSSKIVGRCKREMAEMCVEAVLSVADLARRDVNLDLIKLDGKVRCAHGAAHSVAALGACARSAPRVNCEGMRRCARW